MEESDDGGYPKNGEGEHGGAGGKDQVKRDRHGVRLCVSLLVV